MRFQRHLGQYLAAAAENIVTILDVLDVKTENHFHTSQVCLERYFRTANLYFRRIALWFVCIYKPN
ncbi:hypothetical protein MA16_Dca008068 [Dendrobium catenatum]|uniref:Uncharacterized protein n=1 Tax=Dendrobium catenatum TaxID=906689 RepID=A0A2I0WCW7_9ASPA|nr:hypothetical protein MA16_Dca008068 [Dendrobium catenatum]